MIVDYFFIFDDKTAETSEIAQMTPAYIEATLCGGGCHNSRQSCVPVQSKVRTLMIILKIVMMMMMPNLTASRLCYMLAVRSTMHCITIAMVRRMAQK